jgi:hypothetical protein
MHSSCMFVVLPHRLCAYARSVGHTPAMLKEFAQRNGTYFEESRQCVKQGRRDPTPLHTALLLPTPLHYTVLMSRDAVNPADITAAFA